MPGSGLTQTDLRRIAIQAAEAAGLDASFIDRPSGEQRRVVEELHGRPMTLASLAAPFVDRDGVERSLDEALAE